MPEEYAARLARHLLALDDLEPVFEVDAMDHVEPDRLIAALEHHGCKVERVHGKTRLIVTHPRLAQEVTRDGETTSVHPERVESAENPPSLFSLFLWPRLSTA